MAWPAAILYLTLNKVGSPVACGGFLSVIVGEHGIPSR